MKNSIEEDIEILEEKMNKELDFLIESANKTEQLTAISIIAMKEPIILLFLSVLSDYKRVLKENEELKSNNEKYTIHLTDKQYNAVIENAQNDINQKWIQKVKDKISERQFELQQEYKDFEDDSILTVLQELLEGRK